MQPLDSSYHESGWPRWAFFTTIPLVLALGLITGMAVATYTAAAPPVTPPQQTAGVPPHEAGGAEPEVTGAQSSANSSWQIPGKRGLSTNQPETTDMLPVTPDPRAESGIRPGTPTRPQITGPPADAAEAAIVLANDFGIYTNGSVTLRIDYQQMRQSGQGVSVVGLVSTPDYPGWARALQESPDQLAAWLQAAAARVQSAAVQERFFVSWAVVDLVSQRPAGFGDHEITPLTDGTFLVVRPLAATVDYAKTEISLRPLASLSEAAGGRRTAPDGPWATYGPALHFDSTDIYRPVPLGAKPLSK